MANYLAGDILEIVCKHPDLGVSRFQVKSNESINIDFGGLRSDDDAGSITGAGDFIDKVNRVRWSMEGPIAVDFVSGNETDKLNELAESSKLGTWTITHISGAVWKGQGKPVGDLSPDTNTAQMTLKVAGSRKLEKL